MLLVALLHCTVCVAWNSVWTRISAVRIASLSPPPPPPPTQPNPTRLNPTQPNHGIYFSHNILEGCFEYISHYCTLCLWWRVCLTGGITELYMVLFSFQVSDLLTAFRLPVWSNVDRVVLLHDFDIGAERELWGRQRHRRTQSGVSASVIVYVAFIPKCGSVKSLGTPVRRENSNSWRFYGNSSTWGMFAAVKLSALFTDLRTIIYTDAGPNGRAV